MHNIVNLEDISEPRRNTFLPFPDTPVGSEAELIADTYVGVSSPTVSWNRDVLADRSEFLLTGVGLEKQVEKRAYLNIST